MSTDAFAVKVDNLYKSFKLPHERQGSIKSALINFRKRGYEVQHVLDDINIEIKKGEFFGIVGRNGSGKSTLLKLLAGIYSPDSGAVHVRGTLTPFIELGVGFNPELTGRENVYLNGALLGFNRKDVNTMYGDIVDFAELERFMDQKLKNYSSGMQVRLAFSIAIRARSDILLLDEVLAVGDEAFQRKCFSYFETLKRNKKTVILVTHDMAAVERFCSRAMFIEDGVIKLIGKPTEVAAAYSRSNDDAYVLEEAVINQPEEEAEQEPEKSNLKIEIMNDAGKPTKKFTTGDTMRVKVSWNDEGVQHAGVAILKLDGEYVFGPSTYQDKKPLVQGSKSITYRVKLNIAEGDYFLKAGTYSDNDMMRVDFEDNGPGFTVNRDKNDTRWGGITKLEYEWIEP